MESQEAMRVVTVTMRNMATQSRHSNDTKQDVHWMVGIETVDPQSQIANTTEHGQRRQKEHRRNQLCTKYSKFTQRLLYDGL